MISQRLHNERSAYKQTSKRHKRQTNTPQQDTREKEKIRQPAPTSSFCNNPSTKLYTFPFTQPLWFASLLPSCSPPLPPSFTHHLQSPFLNSQLMTGNSSHQGYFTATYPQQPQWNMLHQTNNKHTNNNGLPMQNNPFGTKFQ
jgi:hypothetical protein